MAHRERRESLAGFPVRVGAVLALAGATLLASPDTLAGAEPPQLTIVVPGELRADSHVSLVLRLTLPPGTAEPLLVTPFREGESIEVVRGRLLRSDARRVEGGLEFDLPLRTHGAGTAVLGARVLAYVCDGTCQRINVEARTKVVVLPP